MKTKKEKFIELERLECMYEYEKKYNPYSSSVEWMRIRVIFQKDICKCL